MALFTRSRRLNLALQGGGAHGAFTWGALDRLLEEEDIGLGWISGTSAGAVNAVALASGLATSGRAGARATLKRVWEAVEAAANPDLARLNPFLYGMTKASGLGQMGSLLSPYDFNPLNIDPLRKLIAEHVDFAAIRSQRSMDLLIAATDVATGRPRLFRRNELSVECVLASACLPQLHHAVEIDGRAYWDGGFSANPDILSLASESPAADTLLVQLNPLERPAAPRTARDITAHVGTITFNQPLLRDVEIVVAAQDERVGRGWFRRGGGRLARLSRHRFHLIDAGRYTAALGADSKASPERTLLAYLFTAGRSEMSRWLDRHRQDIGRRQTADLRRHYLERALDRLPAGDRPAASPAEDDPADALGTRI